MKRILMLLIAAAAALVATAPAMAAPSVHPTGNAAVQAYRREISQDCQSGAFVQSELQRLYQVANASGYRGYLPTPEFAQDACEQAP